MPVRQRDLVRLTGDGLYRLSRLALLLLLTGCAAQPPSRAPRWYGQGSAGHRTVENPRRDVALVTSRESRPMTRTRKPSS